MTMPRQAIFCRLLRFPVMGRSVKVLLLHVVVGAVGTVETHYTHSMSFVKIQVQVLMLLETLLQITSKCTALPVLWWILTPTRLLHSEGKFAPVKL